VESSQFQLSEVQDFRQQPTGNQITKNILVLYDRKLLFDIIKTNLDRVSLSIKGIGSTEFSKKSKATFETDNLDLIIIALSSSSKGEPLIYLFNTALIKIVGKIPLLIVSDRKFDSDDEGQIFHLELPFDVSELHDKVQSIINMNGNVREKTND